MESRIELTDTPISMITKMSEGIIGAAKVVCDIIEITPKVDPEAMPLSHILMLDTWGIYGSRIWMFYKDFCKEDIEVMIGMIRALQMGIITEYELNNAIDNYGKGIDIPTVIDLVKTALPCLKISPLKQVV